MKNIQIGIIGLGTVGTGVYNVLKRNQTEIVRRAGCDISISMVSRRDTAKAHEVVDTHTVVTDNPQAIIDNPDIDIVVELIGGCTVAKELVLAAIHAGKHVVTANKALLAIHGEEIFAAAKAANNGLGVMVA
ncbi:MAG: hypothetical protein RI956_84, partial [Pseudomonadota bacterium]